MVEVAVSSEGGGECTALKSFADNGDSAGASGSALAALSRALVGTLAFLFKRPIRLFRPVKISSWVGIQALAEEQGKQVTPAFVRGLIRKEGWHFFPRHILPPLAINASLGFTLFSVYTLSESFFTPLLPPSFTSANLTVPFISGALAGAAQAVISAPLDNARLLLLRRQRLLRLHTRASSSSSHSARLRRHLALSTSKPFEGWWALLRDAVFHSPSAEIISNSIPTTSTSRRKIVIARAREWARRGWSLWGLSLSKDAIAFGAFFAIFETGREGAKRAGLAYDGLLYANEEEDKTQGRRRSSESLVLQSFLILVAGGMAGWSFSIVARPFERVRGAIWEGRSKWAERDGKLKVAEEEGIDLARRKKQGSRKRIERDGGVGRTFAFIRSRRRRKRLKEIKARTKMERGTVSETRPRLQATDVRQPLPSAAAWVRVSMNTYGPLKFLFASRSTLQRHPAYPTLPPPSVVVRPKLGPTRLSARRKISEAAIGRGAFTGWKKATKILAFLPPYSIGLLVYAVMSGDLR